MHNGFIEVLCFIPFKMSNNPITFSAPGNPQVQIHDYSGVRECLTLV